MPLFPKRNKKPMDDCPEPEMESGKPSIAIAYGIQKKNKKKMASGGEVPSEGETVGSIIGYPGSPKPVKKAHGGEIQQADEAAKGMVDHIMMKRKAKMMAEGGMVDSDEDGEETPASLSPYDDDNSEAVKKELYEDDQLESDPMDSNERGDEIAADAHDMVSKIRAKMKARL